MLDSVKLPPESQTICVLLVKVRTVVALCQVVCLCVLVSCKQWFVGCCFRVLPSNWEKVSYHSTRSRGLVNWMLVFSLFKCGIRRYCFRVQQWSYRKANLAREGVFHGKLLGPVPRRFCMAISAITTERGELIAVPRSCFQCLPLYRSRLRSDKGAVGP